MIQIFKKQKFQVALKTVFVLLIVANLVTIYMYFRKAAEHGRHVECETTPVFVNKLLNCGHDPIIDKRGYIELKNRLTQYIDGVYSAGTADIVAVRFRDLDFGPTLGINDRKNFIPASLLKLPLVLTFFELAEDTPDLFSVKLAYIPEATPTLAQTFLPENKMIPNREYSIENLIYRTVVESDNVAAQLLYQYLLKYDGGASLSDTYRALGIIEPGTDPNKAVVNAKDYASIFRQLYNVSYLNMDSSEELLSLLSLAVFPDGLRAGVPEGIKISHKFGERYLPNGKKQLHDCGIVYYPGNPYEICVMTEGDDFAELESIIGDISKMTYDEFNSRNIINRKL